MDVDFLNLSPEAQMDLMNVIYMEKLAEFSETTTLSSDALAPGSSQALYTTPAAPHSPVLYFGASPSLLHATPGELSSVAAMREVIFRTAAMQPVQVDPESVKAPKRRNVRISKDPLSVAARHRRERISEKIRTLQRLVPGGTKMDTASMLDQAIHYVRFLQTQVQSMERAAAENRQGTAAARLGLGFSCYSSLDHQEFSVQIALEEVRNQKFKLKIER